MFRLRAIESLLVSLLGLWYNPHSENSERPRELLANRDPSCILRLRARRYSLGVPPTIWREVLDKCAWLDNRRAIAMSIGEMEFPRNIVCVCSTGATPPVSSRRGRTFYAHLNWYLLIRRLLIFDSSVVR